MVIKEIKEMNGGQFIVHKSDKNLMIQKTGTEEIYSETWDVIPCLFEYTETEQSVEVNETKAELANENNLLQQ